MNSRHVLAGIVAMVFLASVGAEPPTPRPRLAVVLVFDQLRGDYLVKWNDLFVADGFRRLMKEGSWFSHCHYPYAMTYTGPGHASLLSGCSPDRHGIVANSWHDRKLGDLVNCATDERYVRVPPLPVLPAAPKSEDKKESEDDEKKPKGFGAPTRMLAPTLADSLKDATQGLGKVFGLSLKDRSAILPTGKKPNGCYWFDKGQFITSTYYGDRLHQWVVKFNESKAADRWHGKQWERLRSDLNYDKLAGPDESGGEDKGYEQGTTFPHSFGKPGEKIGSEYYSAVTMSPMGNELLLELAYQCIEAEKLGQDEIPDLLTISFSSNDLIGHGWGPDSHEVLDVTLRSDLLVRDLLKFLDEKVGQGKYVVALSADHGICPLPEAVRKHGVLAGRVFAREFLTAAESYLRHRFGEPEDSKTRWIEAANEGGVYLNERLIKSRNRTMDEVGRELVFWLMEQSVVQTAYTARQLNGSFPDYDDIGRRAQKSHAADRSGDVIVYLKPFFFLTTRKLGTTHGSPHSYDTHVPLIVYGGGVKSGQREDPVTPQALAAILAKALGIPAPAKCEAPVPSELFK